MIALIIFVLVPSPHTQLDAHRLAESIRAVENWKPGSVGRAGEVGPWQITPKVWKKHSTTSQWSASVSEHRRVALAHIAEIRAGIRRNGIHETPRTIALAYTAGLNAAINGKASRMKLDYADRAANVYHDLE